MNVLDNIKSFFLNYKLPRFRDKSNWYATDLPRNMRDLYWERKGEPSTSTTDLKGAIRMFMGKAIEVGLVKEVFSQLHLFGLHLIGASDAQITVGYTDPVNVSGLIDLLVCERENGKLKKPVVGEIKCVWGYGASMIVTQLKPKEDHLIQLGSYLYRLHQLKKTSEGFLLYVPMEGDYLGEMVLFSCKFDYKTKEVTAYKAETISGNSRSIDMTICLTPYWDKLKQVEECLEKDELPPAEHYYKHPITQTFLESLSDTKLRDAIAGKKIIGDWQIQYSRYFQKHLELEGSARQYTEDELKLLKNEYLKRHPKTRKYK